jgi:hypothetical protein
MLALVFVLQLGLAVPAAAQTDQKAVKCGTDQVPIGVSINGDNCIDTGTTVETNVIFVWLSGIIKFLTVGVGIAATGGVVYGGFLYLTARGNAGQTEKGVMTIINALIGVLLYALAFAIINYLVPGGVLK